LPTTPQRLAVCAVVSDFDAIDVSEQIPDQGAAAFAIGVRFVDLAPWSGPKSVKPCCP